jgi:hypothetical protein
MYEQWFFLGLVDVLRREGIQLTPWEEALKDSAQRRFTIDFDRGLEFRGKLTPRKMLRIRYEPWILPRSDALATGETLCHGSSSCVPWCPDVVVECLSVGDDGQQLPLYGIAIDCKYSPRVADRHWNATRKYTQIRATNGNRQVVKQLWIVCPDEHDTIRMVDPAVGFDERGPACPPGETVEGVLPCVPGTEVSQSTLQLFADAVTSYLKRIPAGTGNDLP